jgi:hypothetical protein
MKGGEKLMVTEYADRTMASHESMAKTVATGSGVEAVAGGAALVLAILGLAGLLPMVLASIAVIAAGAAFLFQGAAVAARHRRLALEAGGGEAEIETGMSTEIAGGLAGIALGILALIGIETVALLAISAIVFGGTLLFGSPPFTVRAGQNLAIKSSMRWRARRPRVQPVLKHWWESERLRSEFWR